MCLYICHQRITEFLKDQSLRNSTFYIAYTCLWAISSTKLNVNYLTYADDMQMYLALPPDAYSAIESLCHCLEQVSSWMNQKFLQLNQDRIEIVFGSKENRAIMLVKTSSHCH